LNKDILTSAAAALLLATGFKFKRHNIYWEIAVTLRAIQSVLSEAEGHVLLSAVEIFIYFR
jgi:hypothetical protein